MATTHQIQQIQNIITNIPYHTTHQLIMNGKTCTKLLAYLFDRLQNSDQPTNQQALELNRKIKDISQRNRREIKRPINYVEEWINKRNQLKEFIYSHDMSIQTDFQDIIGGVKSPKNLYFQRQLHNFHSDVLKQHQNYPDHDEKINHFFQAIAHQSIPLQHPSSAALSSVLYQNTFISNPHDICPYTLGLTYQQLWNLKNLRQYACCLANKGGGYIIIGVNQINKNKVEGFEAEKFNPFEYQQFLKKIENGIRPPIEILCEHIPVFIDYPKSDADIYSTNLICLKLMIRTLYHGYLHYIEMKTKGYHDLFEIYYLKPRNIIQEIKNSEIYGRMVAMFEQRNRKKLQKGYNFSEKVYETPLNFLTTEIQPIETKGEESEILQTERALYEPKFQFKENSFIIVGSEKKNKFIQKFRLLILEKKISFTLMRPFEKYLIKGGRVIWFFSYNYKYQHMREVIKNCDKGKNFTFTPITKTIRIPKKKITDPSFSAFKEEFNHLYPNAEIQIIEGKYQGLDQNLIDCYFICFPDFTTAVWGFCLFEGMNFKPYCITNKAKQGFEKGKWDQDHHYTQQSKGDLLYKI